MIIQSRVKVRYRDGWWQVRHNGKTIAHKLTLESAHAFATRYSHSARYVSYLVALVA